MICASVMDSLTRKERSQISTQRSNASLAIKVHAYASRLEFAVGVLLRWNATIVMSSRSKSKTPLESTPPAQPGEQPAFVKTVEMARALKVALLAEYCPLAFHAQDVT